MPERTLIDDILAPGGLSILFQPIFEIINEKPVVFALEALSRGPKNSNAERAEVLFEYVRRKGRKLDVDRVCVTGALTAAARFPGAPAISINVHASTLERDALFVAHLLDTCEDVEIEPSRVILEIVEQQRFADEVPFLATLATLRAHGVRIALDDIGLGYSNHRMLIEIQPDLYKIDRYFVHDSKTRPRARAAIESLALLALRLDGRVVAEGIENVDDYETIRSCGIDLVQGYYFARPQSPDEILPHPRPSALTNFIRQETHS